MRKNQSGFTLVELLVVIGVIALLIAMLMPALQRARESANSIKCMANLRQIGMGFSLYENRYNNYVPAGMTSYTGTGDPGDWTALITPMLYNGKMKSYDFSTMLRCPSNVLANTARLPAEGYSYAVGTGLNGNLMRWDLGPLPMKITGIRQSGDKIMVFETNTPLATVGSVNFDYSGNKSAYNWHKGVSKDWGSANFLMCDGSVQNISDKWLSTTNATRTTDGTKETRRKWFRTTQSQSQVGPNSMDRWWRVGP